MTTKKDLKRVMKEIKHGVKRHRNLQKTILNTKKNSTAEDRALLGASRKNLMVLLAREEVIENRLIDISKTIKNLPKNRNGVAFPRSEKRAEV